MFTVLPILCKLQMLFSNNASNLTSGIIKPEMMVGKKKQKIKPVCVSILGVSPAHALLNNLSVSFT